MGLGFRVYYWGCYRDNGKENGNYKDYAPQETANYWG